MPHEKYRGPLAKPLPPKKQRKRIRRMSKKRQKSSRIYNEMAKAFLIANPKCQVKLCFRRSTQVHHTRGRHGTNYLDMTTWLATCNSCHDDIHRHPAWAKKQGYLHSFHA